MKVGDRVKFINPPVEHGKVLEIDGPVVVVELDKEYRTDDEDGFDDGLRESLLNLVEPE